MRAGALGQRGAALEQTVELAVGGLQACMGEATAEVGSRGEPLEERHHPQQVLVGKQEVASGARALAAEQGTGVMQATEGAAVGGKHSADGVLVGQKSALRADDRKVDHPRFATGASCVRLQRKWAARDP